MNEKDSSLHLSCNKLDINKSFQEEPQIDDEYLCLSKSLNILPTKKFYSGKYHYIRDFAIEEAMTTVFFRPVHHDSLSSSIFCMICVTLGTGMLPIPHLFSSNGLILTFILFLFFSFPTYKTMQILIKISHNNKIYNFPELVSKYFGNNSFMTKLTIIALLINSFGCIILWNVYINKFSIGLIEFFAEDYATNQNGNYICLIILIFIQIPLAIYNKGNEFDLMATVGFFQIVYVLVVLIIEFPSYIEEFYDKKIFFRIKTYFNNKILKLWRFLLCYLYLLEIILQY